MVREVKLGRWGSSTIAEQEEYLRQVMEEEEFPSDFSELMCAITYLEECGASWQEIGRMTVEKILERYYRFLQKDVPLKRQGAQCFQALKICGSKPWFKKGERRCT